MLRQPYHGKRTLTPTNRDAVSRAEWLLDLAIDDCGDNLALGQPWGNFEPFVSGVDQRTLGQCVVQIGVMTNIWASGGRIGPPAERL